MSLQRLDIYDVRNIHHASFSPSAALNFIVGCNGSGKSALLEAIFILGRAASFRSAHIKTVINHQATRLVVSGQVRQKNSLPVQLGVQLDPKHREIHINQTHRQRRAELAYALPIQLITPTSFQLLDGSASYRREFMDWGVFNQDEHFLPLWRRFKKALLQRNAHLKSKSLRQIQTWNKELVEYAIPIANFRANYIQMLLPVFLKISQSFLSYDDIELAVFSGWGEQQELHQLLEDNIDKDCRYGFTQYGPHRGDFQLLVNKAIAKDFVSRGQLKLLVLALKLAQVHLLQKKFSKIGCILIDDLAAELDLINRIKLLDYLAAMEFQVFLTATEISDFGDLKRLKEFKMFHVEHGCIK